MVTYWFVVYSYLKVDNTIFGNAVVEVDGQLARHDLAYFLGLICHRSRLHSSDARRRAPVLHRRLAVCRDRYSRIPPSTWITCPVTYFAASDAR